MYRDCGMDAGLITAENEINILIANTPKKYIFFREYYMPFFAKRFLKLLITISMYSPLALFWMVKAFIFDFPASRFSFMKLPRAGRELGLRHVKSDVVKEFGMLRGTVSGYRVTVKPDEHLESFISVEFPNAFQGLDIETSKSRYRTPENIVDIETSSWKFNSIFRTRRAGKEIAVQIQNSREFLDCAVSYYETWIFRLGFLMIHENEILCKLKSPDQIGFFPYIPASKLRPLVEGLVEIAGKLDSISES